jgi:hypothetical protein
VYVSVCLVERMHGLLAGPGRGAGFGRTLTRSVHVSSGRVSVRKIWWCLVGEVKIFGCHIGCIGRMSGGVFEY